MKVINDQYLHPVRRVKVVSQGSDCIGRYLAIEPISWRASSPATRGSPSVSGTEAFLGDLQPSRQEPDQRGEDRAVGPVWPGPGTGAAQHGDLVPQHEQFRVLGGRRPAEQDQPAAEPDEDKVKQALAPSGPQLPVRRSGL